jgi:ketosteroid isomerase-like protein
MHPNAELIQRAYEATSRGDTEAVRAILADDVVWHLPGRNRFSGDHVGKTAVFDVFQRRREYAGPTFNMKVHDVLANDEHAVDLVSIQGEREGRPIAYRSVGVYNMRDEKIVEAWAFNEDQYAVDEFWE